MRQPANEGFNVERFGQMKAWMEADDDESNDYRKSSNVLECGVECTLGADVVSGRHHSW